MDRHTSYIAIGSNLGDPLQECQRAVADIAAIPLTRLIQSSSFFRTEPLLGSTQNGKDIPWYVNAVCKVETSLSPLKLFEQLQAIEKSHGRVRREKWGPRVLDLDLISYDHRVVSSRRLSLPHPGVASRRFVLEPLYELDPCWVHPTLGLDARQLLGQLENPLSVTKLEGAFQNLPCDPSS